MSDKILIVDDETEIADLIELYLKNEDFVLYKFYTAKEALDCARQRKRREHGQHEWRDRI